MKDFKECWESENEPVVKGNNAVKETKKWGLCASCSTMKDVNSVIMQRSETTRDAIKKEMKNEKRLCLCRCFISVLVSSQRESDVLFWF